MAKGFKTSKGHKSAISGRFVTSKYGKEHPKTTYKIS